MMRFLLDCLRPGRQRASCGRENSVEIPTKEKDAGNDDGHELKDLEDVVAMEEGALQRDRAQCRDSQQALESLAKRRTQLREEIEVIQEKRKKEGQLLLSLQEEQEELEQRVQEYDAELTRAKEELRRLQEEISGTRARVEEAHGRMGPLKHCIGETYTEITEAKQRLGELITEMIAIEACAPEITAHHSTESLSTPIHSRSGEEDEDEEEYRNRVYEEGNAVKHHSVENEASEQEHDGRPEKLQRSAENLKSSGSSSFTEITLTEFKEEDASPRSITSQHTDSADLEEDFEIVQSLMSKPVNRSASKDFDFFNPDPFVDYDVFGDERFPKVDMTEFLSGDPFKGSDPFACDNMFSDVANSPFPQDSPLSDDGNAQESNPLPWSPESACKEETADIANVARIPASSTCSQSIDSGMFEQNLPELGDSEKHVSYDDVCPQVGIEITVTRDFDNEELSNSLENQAALPASPETEDGGRFDPIVCEHNDVHESESSSTVDSSFDGDFGAAEEHPVEEPEVEAGPSCVRRNRALFGLQRIDTSSYTSFPLSPEAYDPEPFPVSGDTDEKPSSFGSDHDTVNEVKAETEVTEDTEQLSLHTDPGNPSSSNQEMHEVKSDLGSLELKEDHFSNPNDASRNEEPCDSDDHTFGDIYFFTVRLDPGSSDASPVSPEVSERKKSEGDHASPESVDTGEFDYVAPEDEEPMQRSLEEYQEESFDKDESEVRPETPTGPEQHQNPPPEPKEPNIESEAKNPDSAPISVEHEDQSAGHDPFECNLFDSESNNGFKRRSENAHNVDLAFTVDTNLGNCNTEPVVQYLISPVCGDTGMFATDGYKLCARNPFSFDAGSIDHCDNNEEYPRPPDLETCVVMESGLAETNVQSLVILDPVLIGNPVRAFEAKTSTAESGRLDSGYHEFIGMDPFSPTPTDLCPASTEMGPGSVTENLEIEVPGSANFDAQVPDPFSPETNDTTMFDSEPEICNPVTIDGITKDSGLGCTGSSDVLADSFSGSELDSFDPFSPMPHLTGSNYTLSNVDILVPGAVRDNSISYDDNRSGSWDSGVSQSPQIHCDSAPNTVQYEANLVSPDTQNVSYSPSYSTTDIFFQSDSNTLIDVGPFTPKVEKISIQDNNSTVSVTAMEDLAEIDFFCSELSKMVASRSSDSVQQSVTEMLFGSNPDTAKFYPWDLDNSSTDIKETSSPEENDEKPCLL